MAYKGAWLAKNGESGCMDCPEGRTEEERLRSEKSMTWRMEAPFLTFQLGGFEEALRRVLL